MENIYTLMKGDGVPRLTSVMTGKSTASLSFIISIWLFGTFLLLSVFTAAVFAGFREQMVMSSKDARSFEVASMANAFMCLSTSGAERNSVVLMSDMKRALAFVSWGTLLKTGEGKELVCQLLDQDASGEVWWAGVGASQRLQIGIMEFFRLLDLLQLHVFCRRPRRAMPESIQRFRKRCRAADLHPGFFYFSTIIVGLQLVVTLLEAIFPCYETIDQCPGRAELEMASLGLFLYVCAGYWSSLEQLSPR